MGKRIKSEKKGGGKNQSSLKNIHPAEMTTPGCIMYTIYITSATSMEEKTSLFMGSAFVLYFVLLHCFHKAHFAHLVYESIQISLKRLTLKIYRLCINC
jgi:hypothetical protein